MLHHGEGVLAVRGVDVEVAEVVPVKARGLSDHDGVLVRLAPHR